MEEKNCLYYKEERDLHYYCKKCKFGFSGRIYRTSEGINYVRCIEVIQNCQQSIVMGNLHSNKNH